MQSGHIGKTVRFKDDEDYREFLRQFRSMHPLSKQYPTGQTVIDYPEKKYDFCSEIRVLLKRKGIASAEDVEKLDRLENLHRIINPVMAELDDTELNEVSRLFYETSTEFLTLYRRFVDERVAPFVGEPIYYQKTPTIRFHFPHQKGFRWRATFHTDIMLGHPPQEFNIWIPLTKTSGTNSMLLTPLRESLLAYKTCNFDFEELAEKVQHDADFAKGLKQLAAPIESDLGKFVAFDPRCIHATQHNNTGCTRISIDVRVLSVSAYKNRTRDYRGTGRRRLLFAPGHYFHEDPVGCSLVC